MTGGSSPNEVRRALAAGPVLGTFVKLPSTELIDLVAAAGFDLVVIDLEHSQLDDGQARHLVRHAFGIGLPALVRMPAVDRGLVNRLLEAGACGIQLSTTLSRRQVEELLAATRYAPDGERSISLAHVRAGYGATSLAQFVVRQQEDPPLVVSQFETATTLDDLGAIVRPPMDAAFIGTADLSVSMQRPGELGHPDVVKRMREIAASAAEAGVHLGGYAGNRDGIQTLLDLGARYILVGSDIATIGSALGDQVSAAVAAFREHREG